MIDAVRFLAVVAAVAYVVIAAVMYLRQRELQYFPDNKGLTPAAVGLSDVEVVKLATLDGENIVAWHSAPKPGRPAILYFHGNAGEIGDRADRFAAYQSQGFGVLFVSYRGYSGSSGEPSELGLTIDALAAYDWLARKGLSPHQIAVVGESLGSSVAVQLTAQRKVGALALEAPFASAADIAAQIYWWLPVRLLMKDQFQSIHHIGQIDAPLLVVHGEFDEIIPLREGERLFAAAKEPKEMAVIKGGSHASIFGPETWAREIAFFDRVLGK